MNNAMDSLELLIDLGVNEALKIAFRGIFVDWAGVRNVILLEILSVGNERRREALRYEKCRWVLRVAHRYVAVRVNYLVIVENVVCCDKRAEEVFRCRLGSPEQG